MVSNITTPHFTGGANVAIKVPTHKYDETIAFYRDTLSLPLIEEEPEGCIFQFGPIRLWVDKDPHLSHPDIWFEIQTNDTEAAAHFFEVNGVTRRDEIEELPEDFDGFFVTDPAGVIHLVVGEQA